MSSRGRHRSDSRDAGDRDRRRDRDRDREADRDRGRDADRERDRDRDRDRARDRDGARRGEDRDRPERSDRDRDRGKTGSPVRHKSRSASPDRRRARDGSRSPSVDAGRKSSSRRDRDRDEQEDRRKDRRKRSPTPSASESASGSASDSDRSSGSNDRRRKKESKEDKRRRKEAAKTRETSEERAARRAAKKARKSELLMGYTNDENPFGDSNLSEHFVWKKKVSKEIAEGKRVKPPSKSELRKLRESQLEELKKAKQSREQRLREREEQERLKQEEITLREMALLGDWESKEAEFHREQANNKSIIRLREGRHRSIDMLAKNLILMTRDLNAPKKPGAVVADDLDVCLEEPYVLIDRMGVTELEELVADVADRADLMRGTNESEYWEKVLRVAKASLKHQKEKRSLGEGVHAAVYRDVENMFGGQSLAELSKLEPQIRRNLENAGDGPQAQYWRDVCAGLEVHLARAWLKQFHTNVLKTHLTALERAQLEQAAAARAAAARVAEVAAQRGRAGADSRKESEAEESEGEDVGELQEGDRAKVTELPSSTVARVSRTGPGAYSPVCLRYPQDGDGDMVDEAADAREIDAQYSRVFGSAVSRYNTQGNDHLDHSVAAARMLQDVVDAGLEEMEEALAAADEVNVDTEQLHLWQDKYRPRKPRYYVRVKTGYEWNKYNQSHYDPENPPPKSVQGYKFHLFYPDLIYRNKAPYFILQPANTPDFCIIRFHAGPPYEDVAFKIVNREWEKSHRYGFRYVFERGVLQLFFHFKKYRYRR